MSDLFALVTQQTFTFDAQIMQGRKGSQVSKKPRKNRQFDLAGITHRSDVQPGRNKLKALGSKYSPGSKAVTGLKPTNSVTQQFRFGTGSFLYCFGTDAALRQSQPASNPGELPSPPTPYPTVHHCFPTARTLAPHSNIFCNFREPVPLSRP
jgi:hypothetical protein